MGIQLICSERIALLNSICVSQYSVPCEENLTLNLTMGIRKSHLAVK